MMPIDMARDPTPWILLYDPDCGFCRWSLAWVLRADRSKRLRPVPLGSREADELLADLTPEERMRSWHLIAPDGRRWSAGYAAAPLLRLLPGGRLPAAALAAAPEITDRVYRWVADHRSTLSKLIPERGKRRADERLAAHM
jgi:predicted DCC family thiol-disulfide oxidoreductase YuxK